MMALQDALRLFLQTGQLSLTGEAVKGLIESSVRERNLTLEAQARFIYAQILRTDGMLKEAKEEARSSLGLCIAQKLCDIQPLLYATLGYIASAHGDVETAVQMYLTGLSMTETNVPTYARIHLLTNLAGIYCDYGNVEQGIQLHEQSLAFARQLTVFRVTARTLWNISGCYLLIEDFASALNYAREACEAAAQSKDSIWILNSRVREASVVIELQDYNTVLSILDSIQNELDHSNQTGLQATALLLRAKTYRLLQRYDISQHLFEEAVLLFRNLGNARLLVNALVLSAELYIDTHNFE